MGILLRHHPHAPSSCVLDQGSSLLASLYVFAAPAVALGACVRAWQASMIVLHQHFSIIFFETHLLKASSIFKHMRHRGHYAEMSTAAHTAAIGTSLAVLNNAELLYMALHKKCCKVYV